jgi:hypothetical protein
VATFIGAHIPDLSSEVEFFDVLYLGIFVVLSPAFDPRFYNGLTPSPAHLKEVAYAVHHFYSLLHVFSQRYAIALEGEVVSHSYVVDRMMGELAAASVVLARGIEEEVGIEELEAENRVTSAAVRERIEEILLQSHPEVIPYYSRCLDRGHKDFLWTGPGLLILPRSDDFTSIFFLTTKGETIDLPSYQIYTEDLDPIPPIPGDNIAAIGKRRVRGGSLNLGDEQAGKRSRKS